MVVEAAAVIALLHSRGPRLLGPLIITAPVSRESIESTHHQASATFKSSLVINHPLPSPTKARRTHSLLQRIIIANTPLHRRPLGNPRNPLLQMRERLHVLFGETRLLPALDPRPSLDIGHAVLAFAFAGEVLALFAGVFAGQLDLEHAVDAQGFVAEALDGVGDFLGGGAGEVVCLACGVWLDLALMVSIKERKIVLTLVGCSGTVPEEDPLQALVTLELVFEAEGVVLVGEFEEV
jgi:hypothetical protein